MRVDKTHPVLQALVKEVSGVGVKDSHKFAKRALPLQRRLVETVANLATPFVGELALIYHEFVIRGPRIDKPVTDYWVRVARLPLQEIKVIDINQSKDKVVSPLSLHRLTDFKPRFLIQVVWQRPLYPAYSALGIRFVLERRKGFRAEACAFDQSIRHLDISALENDLFQTPVVEDRRRKSKITKDVGMLLGTAAVESWLRQYESLDVFRSLVVPKKMDT